MKYRIESHIDSYVTSIYFFLEGDPLHLSYDGKKTYKSTDFVDVQDEKLDITMRIYGLNGTDWKLALNITKEDDPAYKKDYKKEGEITNRQTYLHVDTINLRAV